MSIHFNMKYGEEWRLVPWHGEKRAQGKAYGRRRMSHLEIPLDNNSLQSSSIREPKRPLNCFMLVRQTQRSKRMGAPMLPSRPWYVGRLQK